MILFSMRISHFVLKNKKFVTARNEFSQSPIYAHSVNNGGGGGIRTPARFDPPLGFQDRPLQPDLGTPPYDMD